MTKSSFSLTLFALAVPLGLCASMQAQGGCVNSPENPTVVLALVGLAGAALARMRQRR
jgi:XrtJ-associated TM-motif-TM protein